MPPPTSAISPPPSSALSPPNRGCGGCACTTPRAPSPPSTCGVRGATAATTARASWRRGVAEAPRGVGAAFDAAAGDHITLTGVRAFGHHGVFDHERRDGQEFVVDATAWVDLAAAAASDDVTDTLHYGELAEFIVAEVEGTPTDLIETLAERIAAGVLGRWSTAVSAVRVTVHKPSAPITVPFDDVAVTITRSRHRAGGVDA
ncbi:MAG: dihydroneopterin aldolase [Cryobacterium sp.]|nr:dihydroneopterin aldolase [Cryobacterium sp.]